MLPSVSKVGLSTHSDCLLSSTNASTDYIWHLLLNELRALPTIYTLKPIFVFQVRVFHTIHGFSEANLRLPLILASLSFQFTAEKLSSSMKLKQNSLAPIGWHQRKTAELWKCVCICVIDFRQA